tara:strand:- start:18 stop:449 length:432 start_codon:yes stop_codon:yes gene_type:complete
MKIWEKSKISNLIKIKGPLMMIDSIQNYTIKKNILTKFKVKKNSWFYKYHLINKPIMPGILIEECMFQSAVCLLYLDKKNIDSEMLLLSTNSKFYGAISGENKLVIQTKLLKIKKKMIYFKSQVSDGLKIKCKSDFIIFNKGS